MRKTLFIVTAMLALATSLATYAEDAQTYDIAKTDSGCTVIAAKIVGNGGRIANAEQHGSGNGLVYEKASMPKPSEAPLGDTNSQLPSNNSADPSRQQVAGKIVGNGFGSAIAAQDVIPHLTDCQ